MRVAQSNLRSDQKLRDDTRPLCFVWDDVSVVGTNFALPLDMAEKSLADRVGMLEERVGSKTIEEHFLEQAELIDRRFAEVHARFTAMDARFTAVDARITASDARFPAIDERFTAIDKRFDAVDKRFDAVDRRFEAVDERFSRIDHELSGLRKDVGIVREGVGIIIKKLDKRSPS